MQGPMAPRMTVRTVATLALVCLFRIALAAPLLLLLACYFSGCSGEVWSIVMPLLVMHQASGIRYEIVILYCGTRHEESEEQLPPFSDIALNL